MKYVPPSIKETAFNCPHCGALTTQTWFSVRAVRNEERHLTPLVVYPKDKNDFSDIDDEADRAKFLALFDRLKKPSPFMEFSKDESYYDIEYVYNLNISRCYNCSDLAFWMHDKLIYPISGEAPPANPDIPIDIRHDYDEASAILDRSPRGAAALIRLCIQKLCKHLGQPGDNLNADIGALVKQGLSERVQKALDAVRVIGNNAVHPGAIDLCDDRATAESLFRLLNLIAEKMISEAKHVDDVYAMLPEGARAAIERRDGKKEGA